ncbi:MAG: hypothetical protein V3S64_10385 [bacterium]
MDKQKSETESVSFSVEPTLELFDAIESGRTFTQRNLSTRIGVALGLINALIKRCVKKGLVKVRQAPAKRYAYYLTPSGFREKSHLVSNYLQSSLKIFRRARLEYSEIFAQCQERGWCDLAICGVSDLAEIAIISTLGTGVRIHAIIDPNYEHPEFHRLPVVKSLADAGLIAAEKIDTEKIDAVVLTHQESAQDMFDWLSGQVAAERLFTPPILHVSRNRNGTRSEGEQ